MGILIADDNAEFVALLKEMLLSEGYESVWTASSGEEALEVLRSQERVGLLLLDLVMPGMDGYKLCKLVRSDEAFDHLSIIMVTGNAPQSEEALQRSFRLGAMDFLSKPVKRTELLVRAKSALSLALEKCKNKKCRIALEQREAHFRGLYEHSIDGIFLLSIPGLEIRDMNKRGSEMLGTACDDFLGEPFEKVLADNAGQQGIRRAAELQVDETFCMESVISTSPQVEMPAEIKCVGFQSYGKPSVMVVVSDITAQKQAICKLERSEERYALAVTDVNSGIWDWDVTSGSLFLSDNWRGFLGLLTEDRLDGVRFWKKALHEDDYPLFMKSLRAHWNGDTEAFIEEYRLLGQDGNLCWVLCRGKAIKDHAGEVIRMAGSITDISHLKNLENQVNQMQKMDGLDRFAGGVAHDLNNMVMIVKTYCRFIGEAVEENEDVSRYIHEINQAIEYSRQLVRQLMAFSRRSQIQLEYVFLSEELENLRRMVVAILDEGMTLDTDFRVDLPPIMADHTMISQVVLNLCINARDAMSQGGRLRLSTEAYALDNVMQFHDRTLHPGEYVVLKVKDEGIGMNEETRARVFEPFFTTKTGEHGVHGTGLGLSTVFSIVKNHKGWIEVDSNPGEGTEFRVFFPAFSEIE